MNQVDFSRVPEIGTVIRLGSQSYEIVGTTAHVRRDGSPTTLLLWKTACPTCGDEFNLTTGLVSKNLNRRCSVHRQALKPVSGKRKKVVPMVVRP